MEIQKLVYACNQLLDEYDVALAHLQDAVRHHGGFTFLHQDGALALDPDRTLICKAIAGPHYTGIDEIGEDKSPDTFAVASIDPADAHLVGKLNDAKKKFQVFHEGVTKTQQTSMQASDLIRSVLKKCGRPLLRLDTVDRVIPLMNETVLSVTWRYNSSAVTKRETLGDALNVLEKAMDNVGPDRASEMQAEIDSLSQSMPLDTPLSHQLRKPVTSLRMSVQYVSSVAGKPRATKQLYGKSPLIITAGHPKVKVPFEVGGEGTMPGRGRKKTVCDTPISPLLPKWFPYLEADTSGKKEKKRPARNPKASTPVSQICFNRRASGRPCLLVSTGVGVTSRSITEHGLQSAWVQAVDLLDDITEAQRKEYYALCPSDADLQKFLAS